MEKCEANFEQLKQLLTHATVLNIADLDKKFVVCTYACKRGLGGVFMQEGQVVCYETRKLNEHNQNYVTRDLELATIIHTLKMWRHYLLGRRFVLMRDHNGLRYLFYQPNLNVMKAIWFATLNEFDFEIRYINGKENRVVDALSKKVQVNHIAVVSSNGTELHDRILQVGQKDDKYMEIMQLQWSAGIGIGTCTCTGVGIHAGIGTSDQDANYRLTTNGLVRFENRIYVPNCNELKKVISREFQAKPYSGHPSHQNTFTAMKKFYY